MTAGMMASERAGERGVLYRGQQGNRKQNTRTGHAERRAEQLIGILNFRHVILAARVKGGGGDDENGRVDEEGESQRERGVERGELDRLGFAFGVLLVFARLHDGG